MNLAILTPWPDQKSGIADYAYDLVLGLSKITASVTVYSDTRTACRPAPGAVQVRSFNHFSAEAGKYDCHLFHMGNNPHFHAWMLPLIKAHGGAVHVHDLVLQHLLAAVTHGQGQGQAYLDMIEHWYGNTVRNDVRAMLQLKAPPWEKPVVTDIPLFEEVVQHADACIVHSDFSRQRILSAFPHIEVLKLPHLFCRIPPAQARASEGKTLRIGVFGHVQSNRQVDLVLRALSIASRDAALPVELIVVGTLEKSCEHLPGLAAELGHAKFTTAFMGYVELDELHGLLSSSDLLVSLRYPTMGETSGVVMRGLQYGIPTIVTRIGWYAELPEIVCKVDHGDMLQDLQSVLSETLRNTRHLAEWRARCKAYARSDLDFESATRGYYSFLAQTTARNLVRKQLAAGLLRSKLDGLDGPLLASVVSRVGKLLAR